MRVILQTPRPTSGDSHADPSDADPADGLFAPPENRRSPDNAGDSAESDMSPDNGMFGDGEPLPAPRDAGDDYNQLREREEEDSDDEKKEAERCRRIYNERNCCTADENCVAARRMLRDNPIANISLNITPRFQSGTDRAAETVARTKRLEKAEARTWRDRSGQVVATGRMVDYRFGKVHVAQDGQVAKVLVDRLSDDDACFVAAWWGIPTECSAGDEQLIARSWTPGTMTWKASCLCHKPLYFEEVQLERYGHTTRPLLQSLISGAHFYGNIVALPYRMGINPPHECQYALGYYRPGECAPFMIPPVPISLRGALVETGTVLTGIFVIP